MCISACVFLYRNRAYVCVRLKKRRRRRTKGGDVLVIEQFPITLSK